MVSKLDKFGVAKKLIKYASHLCNFFKKNEKIFLPTAYSNFKISKFGFKQVQGLKINITFEYNNVELCRMLPKYIFITSLSLYWPFNTLAFLT
jgi:hypothetical protein